MATVSLTIPDAQLTRVVNALCKAAGVPATNANAKAQLAERVKLAVKEQERLEAVASAESTVTPVEGIT